MRLMSFVLFALPCALVQLTPTLAGSLPYSTVFQGGSAFVNLVRQAEQENWRALPLGERTTAVGKALRGTPYQNFTLEIDDHTEAPSVNFLGMDCWTYFEVSLAFARMLEAKNPPYTPDDLLALVELDRYRGGRCTGIFTSRLHHLEDWLADNERRGLVKDLTRSLGGVPMTGHYENEMSATWRRSRYLRNNLELVPVIHRIETRLSAQTFYHIPKARVAMIEPSLRDGDVICISSSFRGGITEHVGLAVREKDGVLHFMHASKDARRVVIDVVLHQYLYRYSKFAGIMVARPQEVPVSLHLPSVANAGDDSRGQKSFPKRGRRREDRVGVGGEEHAGVSA